MSFLEVAFSRNRRPRLLQFIDKEGPREPRSPLNTVTPMIRSSLSVLHQALITRAEQSSSSTSVSQQKSDMVSNDYSVLVPCKKRQRQLDADFGPVTKRARAVLSSSTPSLGKPKHEISATSLHKPVKLRSDSNFVGTLKSQQSPSIVNKLCTCDRCKNSSANAMYKQSSPKKNISSQQQIDEGTHEIRPWQRLKKGVDIDGGPWHYDVKSRYGHSSKSQLQDLSGEKAWSVVHASSRSKKQHLWQQQITESDSDDDNDGGSIQSQESTRSYDSSNILQAYQGDELFDSTDGFSDADEHISDASLELEDESKTEHLQAQIDTLTVQNEQKDAQIRALKQRLNPTKVEILRGCTGNLEWQLLRNSDGKLIVLGSGSYGRVYKGRCDNTGKLLAVKVVQDLTKKAADVLEKEVKRLSGLGPHDRIVTYLGTCYAKHPRFNVKSLYVFTEFMPGGSLSSYLARNGPLLERFMWRFAYQILEGVEYLHNCGIIHRDIKGSNIMCSSMYSNSHNSIKLADFGSAKQICSESLDKDKTKYLYGTAPWAAPELLRGEKAHPESDIWSVAATVVEMLTGKTPYKSENFDNQVAIIFQVGSNKIDPLLSMQKSGWFITASVKRFLTKCFKSDANDRPSASALLKVYWPAHYLTRMS